MDLFNPPTEVEVFVMACGIVTIVLLTIYVLWKLHQIEQKVLFGDTNG